MSSLALRLVLSITLLLPVFGLMQVTSPGLQAQGTQCNAQNPFVPVGTPITYDIGLGFTDTISNVAVTGSFNPSFLQVTSIGPGDVAGFTVVSRTFNNTAGTFAATLAANPPVAVSATVSLIRVIFNTIAPTSSTPITFALTITGQSGTRTCTGTAIATITGTLTPTPPTLTPVPVAGLNISEVRVNQAVDAAVLSGSPLTTQAIIDVNGNGIPDLVADRRAVIRVRVSVPSNTTLPATAEVNVSVGFQGQTFQASNNPRTVAQLLASPPPFFDVFVTPSATTSPATISVAATVLGVTPPGASFQVEVKQVRPIRFTYANVNYLGSTGDYPGIVGQVGDFLQGAYPVASNRFFNQSFLNSFGPVISSISQPPQGCPASNPSCGVIRSSLDTNPEAINIDALSLWARNATQAQPPGERVVAIVPDTYFSYHRVPNAGGVGGQVRDVKDDPSNPQRLLCLSEICKVAFVRFDAPITAAHELGHTYGFQHTHQEQVSNGYWVQRQEAIPSAIDYMSDTLSFESVQVRQIPGLWSNTDHFRRLFRQFLVNPSDPDVLRVTGGVRSDGTGFLFELVHQPNGIVDDTISVIPGDAEIQLVDSIGRVVRQVAFTVGFDVEQVMVDGSPASNLTLNEAPFALTVPFVQGASEVRLVRNGRVLARSGIPSIPDQITAAIPPVSATPTPTATPTASPTRIATVAVAARIVPPPPPPVIVLPPPPPPALIPVGPAPIAQQPSVAQPSAQLPAAPVPPEIPIIPEAGSLLLLGGSLGVLAGLAGMRRLRRKE